MKKNAKLKIIGIVILAGAFLAALFIQFFGSGLVAIAHLSQQTQSTDPRLSVAEVVTTTLHMWRIIPLLAIALVGVYFIIISRRHETPVA